MSYIFRGRLCGYICSQCPEPLSNVKVRLYRLGKNQDVASRAVAEPKETFKILTDDEVKAKQSLLIAETETREDGSYTFELNEKQYDGGAFEVDGYCGTVPHLKPGPNPPPPVQFSITTLQPRWRQRENNFLAAWEYCLPYRYWCAVRLRFGSWVICGKVTICDKGVPVGGLRVRAFDVDWLQDDDLGTAVTDAAGKFIIYYSTADFEKTPFSPGINFECVSGPDLYFRVETLGGTPLLVEDRSRGRQPDRHNVGNCFCVDLCVEGGGDQQEDPLPVFSAVGVYEYATDIDSAPGGTGLTNGDNRAFYSSLRLNGILSKRLNGNPMEYKFDYAEYDPITNVLGAFHQVTQAQIGKTLIGKWEIFAPDFVGDPNPIKTKKYTVNGTPGPNELVASFAPDGWIQVPQQSNVFGAEGFFSPNGNMIQLLSGTLAAFGTVDLTGLVAGQSSTATGKPLVQDRHFAIRMRVREAGSLIENDAGICQRIAIDNTTYSNLTHHPSWAGFTLSNELAVDLFDIQELLADGCAEITDTLTVLYTAAHPNLGSVTISMTGPGGPYSFSLAGAVTPDTFGTATPNFVVADLEECAYIVHLSVGVLLTTGDSFPSALIDEIAFCKHE